MLQQVAAIYWSPPGCRQGQGRKRQGRQGWKREEGRGASSWREETPAGQVDQARIAEIVSNEIAALALLRIFRCRGPATEALRIRFAEASEPCKKRGKVGSVKQRLLAELNAFEVTSFDRCVERSATDTKQVKCLPDPVSCLRKTENMGVNRIVTRVLVGPSAWHCSIRRIVYAWFAKVWAMAAVCHTRRIE